MALPEVVKYWLGRGGLRADVMVGGVLDVGARIEDNAQPFLRGDAPRKRFDIAPLVVARPLTLSSGASHSHPECRFGRSRVSTFDTVGRPDRVVLRPSTIRQLVFRLDGR